MSELQSLPAVISSLSEQARTCFYGMSGALQYGDYEAIGKIFNSAWKTVSREERDQIREYFNRNFLFDQQRELAAHGVRRSFRFWSLEEKAEIIRFSREVIDALVSVAGADAALGYGTALAIARSKDLIPHDDDVDIICALPVSRFPTFDDALDHLANVFSETDLKVYGRNPSHCKFNRKHLTLDVFVKLQEDEFISSIPGPRKSILWSDVFPACEIDLFGVAIPVPRDMNAYLTKVYGENWRIPDPMFGHSWDIKPFAGLLRKNPA